MSESEMPNSQQRLAESVSALMDAEASEIELHQVLRAMDDEQSTGGSVLKGQSIRGKWSRYHLVSDSMTDVPLAYRDISGAVSAAIASEETYSAGAQSAGLGQIGRFAVAASVAMIAILGVQQYNGILSQDIQSIQVAEMQAEDAELNRGPAIQFPADFQPSVQARTVSAGGAVKTSQSPVTLVQIANPDANLARNQQLRSLLSEALEAHANNESVNGIQGMLPLARHLDAGESDSEQ